MLIVETADMLQAPLFTAEALLRAHGTIVSQDILTPLAGPNLIMVCVERTAFLLVAENWVFLRSALYNAL